MLVLAGCLLAPVAGAQSTKRLWVLQQPDSIVEYDLATFKARQALKVPRRLLEHPESLSVNARGQMLFVPSVGEVWAGGETGDAAQRAWFWNGREAEELPLGSTTARARSGNEHVVTEIAVRVFLSADADSLVWFENRFEKTAETIGRELSVRSTSRVWRTRLAGDAPQTIALLPSTEPCACETGVCSETCPEWEFWAPDGVVGDVFLATRVTPGQLGPTFHESRLYSRAAGPWRMTAAPQPIPEPLAVSEQAAVLVFAVPDGGCCGWDNESSDQVLVLRDGKVSVLYDEAGRYQNRDYDVSFHAAGAGLAARAALCAYTIVATATADTEIRSSSEGKPTAEGLARLRKAIGDLPAVEIVPLQYRPGAVTTVLHAVFVGWVNDREILLAQDGQLVLYDIHARTRRETGIRIRGPADAFLR